MSADYARQVAAECDEMLGKLLEQERGGEPTRWVFVAEVVRTLARAGVVLHLLAEPQVEATPQLRAPIEFEDADPGDHDPPVHPNDVENELGRLREKLRATQSWRDEYLRQRNELLAAARETVAASALMPSLADAVQRVEDEA